MGMLLIIIAAVIAIPVIGGILGGMFSGSLPVVVMIIGIIVFGGVLREFVKSRKNLNHTSRRDMDEIKQHITQIETDIADIKEQIADFIINQV